jgi:enoyl-CoA hydratase/carnithine racemase
MDPEIVKQFCTLEEVEPQIWVITLLQKTFTVNFFRAIHACLDKLEHGTEGPLCVISTSNHPKIYSAGMNFANFKGQPDEVYNCIIESCRLTARMLALPFPSIAAINGECYAAGYFFACAHDFRIMREDYGKICLSEINLGMPIPAGMNAVVQKKIPHQAHVRTALLGHQWTPKDALENRLVDQIVPYKDLMAETLKMARAIKSKGQHRAAYKAIKETMYEDTINTCRYKSVVRDWTLKPNL